MVFQKGLSCLGKVRAFARTLLRGFLGCFLWVRWCPQILPPWYFRWVYCICVVQDILKCVLEQMVGVGQQVSRGDADCAGGSSPWVCMG